MTTKVSENVIDPDVLTKSRPQIGTGQTLSGNTAVDFTSIPSWVKKITIGFVSISTNGSSNPIVQLGDSGGIEPTGYLGCAGHFTSAAQGATNYTTGFGLTGSWASSTISSGVVTLMLMDAATNTWVASMAGAHQEGTGTSVGGGAKALSGTLDRFRVTTVNGTDTFDGGTVYYQYE